MTPAHIALVVVFTLTSIGAMVWGVSNLDSIKKANQPVSISKIPAADAALLQELADYYKDKKNCPQVQFEQRTLAKWPRLPAIMAGLKFALSREQGWPTDSKSQALRRNLLDVVSDPALKIEYAPGDLSDAELLDRAGRGDEFATGQAVDQNTVRLGPAADFNRYGGQKDPADPAKALVKREDTGLLISVLHELVHVAQLRSKPGLDPSKLHSTSAYERPAYSFSGSEPPLSLIKAAEAFFKAAPTTVECTPKKPTQTGAAPPSGQSGAVDHSFVLVIDASGSMSGQKITDAKRAATDILTSGIPANSQVALTVYTDCGAISWEPFTDQAASLIPKVNAIQPSGSTDMVGALRVAETHLTNGDARGAGGTIILLSDGQNNCGGDPVEAAKSISQKRIPVPTRRGERPSDGGTALFVSRRPVLVPPSLEAAATALQGEIRLDTIGFQVDAAAQKQLQDMAAAGGGSYYSAANFGDLKNALSSVIEAAQPEHPAVPSVPLALEEKGLNTVGGLLPLIAGTTALAVGIAFAAFSIGGARQTAPAVAVAPGAMAPASAAPAGACPSCGAAIEPGARFCMQCGAAAPPPMEAPSSACPSCGAAIGPGARFCMNCGAAVEAAPAPPPAPANTCPGCGSAVLPDAQFCMSCGQAVNRS